LPGEPLLLAPRWLDRVEQRLMLNKRMAGSYTQARVQRAGVPKGCTLRGPLPAALALLEPPVVRRPRHYWSWGTARVSA